MILHDKRSIISITSEGNNSTDYSTNRDDSWCEIVDSILPYAEKDSAWFEIIQDGIICARVNSRHVTEIIYKEIT